MKPFKGRNGGCLGKAPGQLWWGQSSAKSADFTVVVQNRRLLWDCTCCTLRSTMKKLLAFLETRCIHLEDLLRPKTNCPLAQCQWSGFGDPRPVGRIRADARRLGAATAASPDVLRYWRRRESYALRLRCPLGCNEADNFGTCRFATPSRAKNYNF
jgi:hypothetical protein